MTIQRPHFAGVRSQTTPGHGRHRPKGKSPGQGAGEQGPKDEGPRGGQTPKAQQGGPARAWPGCIKQVCHPRSRSPASALQPATRNRRSSVIFKDSPEMSQSGYDVKTASRVMNSGLADESTEGGFPPSSLLFTHNHHSHRGASRKPSQGSQRLRRSVARHTQRHWLPCRNVHHLPHMLGHSYIFPQHL